MSIRVFLVDDVSDVRTLVRMVLEEDPNIEVVGEASDGLEGVEGVAREQPDVVLLDLSMPNMDGLEAIPLMRERAPDARLVVLSGHQAGRISLEAIDQGATRYIDKSSDLAAIRAAVLEVADYQPPYRDTRFGVVREMCTALTNRKIEELLARFDAEATWQPYSGGGRQLHTREEFRDFITTSTSGGRVVDVRVYGVEPRPPGMVVLGSLEIRGPNGLSATEVYWAVCFNGDKVKHAAGFDAREQALREMRDRCAA
jgi:DNA-binding NarL/FixJ family response regulator